MKNLSQKKNLRTYTATIFKSTIIFKDVSFGYKGVKIVAAQLSTPVAQMNHSNLTLKFECGGGEGATETFSGLARYFLHSARLSVKQHRIGAA